MIGCGSNGFSGQARSAVSSPTSEEGPTLHFAVATTRFGPSAPCSSLGSRPKTRIDLAAPTNPIEPPAPSRALTSRFRDASSRVPPAGASLRLRPAGRAPTEHPGRGRLTSHTRHPGHERIDDEQLRAGRLPARRSICSKCLVRSRIFPVSLAGDEVDAVEVGLGGDQTSERMSR